MSDTASPFGALAGLRVIDLTRVLGGPYCTQILADHGADVVKIEPPQGDETRDWGPPFHEGDASYYVGVNRNKRSIGLDLSKDEGREVLRLEYEVYAPLALSEGRRILEEAIATLLKRHLQPRLRAVMEGVLR